MSLALSFLITQARMLAKDTSTTNPGMTDAQLIDRFNDYNHLLDELFARRPVGVSSTTAFGAAAITAGTAYKPTLIATYRDIIGAWSMSADAGNIQTGSGTPLHRLEPHRISALQSSESTQAATTHYSAQRVGVSVAAASTEGLWAFHFWPLPNATTYVSLMVLDDPSTMTLTTDVPDRSEEEGYILSRLVASDLAIILNQPQRLVDHILKPIPDRMMAAARRAPEVLPRRRPVERVS